MKPIELTEEHKSKLLEMCKVLFPEYNWYIGFKTFYEQNGEGPYEEINLGYLHLLSFDILKYPPIYIHWFEFCMTHLAEKVFIQDESLNDYLLTFNVSKHPVDYLYEEFKKLK